MVAYATVDDIQARLLSPLTDDQKRVCEGLLNDAAVLINAYSQDADNDSKKIVSCRMVIRAIGNSENAVPVGATQGSMSALGYTQSWTISSGGSVGELYLSKTDKRLLGLGNAIGASNPFAGGD